MCNIGRQISNALIYDRNGLYKAARGLAHTQSEKWAKKLIKDVDKAKSGIYDRESTLALHISDCKPCNNQYAPLLRRSGAFI